MALTNWTVVRREEGQKEDAAYNGDTGTHPLDSTDTQLWKAKEDPRDNWADNSV